MFREGVSFINDILFPINCVVCGREGQWWCSDCMPPSIAPIVWKPDPSSNAALTHVAALFEYGHEAPIGKCIQALKYNFQTGYTQVWERLLHYSTIRTDFVCIPVPLHSRRMRERGFNQAEYLAAVIAKNHGLSLNADSLKRVRYTHQQAHLHRLDRLRNVVDAFAWCGKVVPRRVYLVDDVYTTGATMQACAQVLHAAGVEHIEGLVVARD